MKNTVTASEIGDFTYCPESWRLHAVGTKPTAAIQMARTQGTEHHVKLAVIETSAGTSIKRGRGFIIVGVLLLALLILFWLLQ